MDREHINALLDMYLSHQSDPRQDAPWRHYISPSANAGMPHSTPNPSTRSDAIIHAAQSLIATPNQVKAIDRALSGLEQSTRDAVLCKRSYAGRVYWSETDQRHRSYTNREMSYMVGQSESRFRRNITQAYRELSDILERAFQY